MSYQNKTKKEYKPSVSPMWTSASGKVMTSLPITQEILDALATAEIGGRIRIRFLDEKSRTKETSPHGYLELISYADEQAFQNNKQSKGL